MKAGVQRLAAHVQLGLDPQKCFQGGSIWPCLLYTYSNLPHNTAKFQFGRVKQAAAYFQDALKETQAMLFPGLIMHSVYMDTEESAAQLDSAQPLGSQGPGLVWNHPAWALTSLFHRVILSTLVCSPRLFQGSDPLCIAS